eukprot:5859904-Amphidinium_carterae.4
MQLGSTILRTQRRIRMAILKEEISAGLTRKRRQRLGAPPPQLLEGSSNALEWRDLLTEHFSAFYHDGSQRYLDYCAEWAFRRDHWDREVYFDPHDLQDLVVKEKPGHKAPGSDSLVWECIKALPFSSFVMLSDIFSAIASGRAAHAQSWHQVHVLLIPKVGRPTQIREFRPLSMLSVTQKLFVQPLTRQISANMAT